MSARRSAVDPARSVALEVLLAVAERDAYANLVLPGLLAERGVAGRDAAFATELVYGALRGQGLLDAVLARCSSRPLERVDVAVLAALRLGAHQLLAMRVPPHAAVGTSVDLVRRHAASAAGFANAVLRRVAAADREAWIAQVAPRRESDPLGHLAVRHSHPRWIVEAFADALGGDPTEVEDLLIADNAAPQVTLVARPGRAEVADLVAAGARPAPYSPYAAVLPGGDVRAVPGIADGSVGVQDEGSQLVALAAANAPVLGVDTAWLDLCAGPGGKAALLAAIGAQRGAALLAVEPQPHRASLVRSALGGGAVVIGDGRHGPWAPGRFDRVVADVPCTGLGALRRRPESRWRRSPQDVARLGDLQRDLLGSAVAAARSGGLIAYITCSPHRAETVDVVAHLRTGGAPVELIDARPLLPGVPDLGAGPTVQLWPHRHGTDAMVCALLRRE
jgi:16S rRNA (cytosine967-C5)-methyltransferase